MNTREPLDPNALKALNQMREEMAKELNTRVQIGGKIGGNMTKRLIEMAEKDLINKK
ncbi:alpha/beta-type small acid-soluble spore protein [Clostridium formicaceticum]|uniref:Small, acid-soluble spore protein A n=1 Tax=Clostridium formicaceticum TaxID=1497 RepID=A0AAC9RKC7_9CLOT|nr:alpha/beta-type small acid-soluble spore protein [Clostridium formicaceticum]ARE87262.1 Small, acid-soluble spore protein A [Clostridium formicaceticum]